MLCVQLFSRRVTGDRLTASSRLTQRPLDGHAIGFRTLQGRSTFACGGEPLEPTTESRGALQRMTDAEELPRARERAADALGNHPTLGFGD